MIKNMKNHVVVALILTSMGVLCSLQAVETEDNNSSSIPQSHLQLVQNTNGTISGKYITDVATQFFASTDLKTCPDVCDTIFRLAGFDDSFDSNLPYRFVQVSSRLGNIIKKKYNKKEILWMKKSGVSENDYHLIKTMEVQYRPDLESNLGMKTLKIPAFSNPLNYRFNLSSCEDTGKYLCISTGYRTGMNQKNRDLVEIWLPLKKEVEKNLGTFAGHYNYIMHAWHDSARVGIFFTRGSWESNNHYNYATDLTPAEISTRSCFNLFDNSTAYQTLFPFSPHQQKILEKFSFTMYSNKDKTIYPVKPPSTDEM